MLEGWRCRSDQDCVNGYACDTIQESCVAADELCIDQDADDYGVGAGCLGNDCDDAAGGCTTDCGSTDNDEIADCKDACVDRDGDRLGDGHLGNTDCISDVTDSDDRRNTVCSDTDADGCDDCTHGHFDPGDDGTDTDRDGQCDAGDTCNDVDRDGLGDGTLGNTGCVNDTTDANDESEVICADTDADGCEDCLRGSFDPGDDGTDTDGDGRCDVGDDDDDGDTVTDGLDDDPLDPYVCADDDADGCDDCSVSGGPPSTTHDGTDLDDDGRCDTYDTCVDVDEDGLGRRDQNATCVHSAVDSNDGNASVCADTDTDTCDDCSSGSFDPALDGTDTDSDGQCNDSDPDDDGDGVDDPSDWEALNRFACSDTDGDTCDDCSSGTYDPDDDGRDTSGDGTCDLASWMDLNYGFRKLITINRLAVQGSHASFPVLVSIPVAADLATAARTDGADIVFADGNGKDVLDYEIERWDKTARVLVAWVSVPGVTSVADMVFYMYYGYDLATDQQNSDGVWDTNFLGVWHFNQVPPATIANSASYVGIQGTANGPASVAGKVGPGLDYGAGSDNVVMSSDAALHDLSAMTFETWVYWRGAGTVDFRRIYSKSRPGNFPPHSLYLLSGSGAVNLRFVRQRNTTDLEFTTDGQPILLNQWLHLAAMFDITTGVHNVFINGEPATSKSPTQAGAGTLLSDASHSLIIGNRGNADTGVNGIMDEVRLSRVVRSADWIKTGYNNQSAPDVFLSIGSQEVIPPH